MNKRTQQLLLDLLLAAVLAIVLGWLSHQLFNPDQFTLALKYIPLVWVGIRHGGVTAVVASVISALGLWLVVSPVSDNQLLNLLLAMVPLLATGITDFFARNTQKTLNNRRYSSTYLNIWTASLLVLGIGFLLEAALSVVLLDQAWQQVLAINNWTNMLLSVLLTGIILTGIVRYFPQWIIPKRSKYLSRIETSSLFND